MLRSAVYRGGAARFVRSVCAVLAMFVVCGVTTTATAENIITNPNFEGAEPGQGTKSIEGWFFTTNTGETWTVAFRVAATPYSDTNPIWYHADLTGTIRGNSNANFENTTGVSLGGGGCVVTEVYLKAGYTYTLTADRAMKINAAGVELSKGDLEYFVGNSPVNYVRKGKFAKTVDEIDCDAGWVSDTAGSFTVEESKIYPVWLKSTSDGGNFVTNVVLDEQVPEPGTWAMLAGLGVVGAAWYRRRKRA